MDFLDELDLQRMAKDVGISTTGSIPDYEWEQMLRREKLSREKEEHKKISNQEETKDGTSTKRNEDK